MFFNIFIFLFKIFCFVDFVALLCKLCQTDIIACAVNFIGVFNTVLQKYALKAYTYMDTHAFCTCFNIHKCIF